MKELSNAARELFSLLTLQGSMAAIGFVMIYCSAMIMFDGLFYRLKSWKRKRHEFSDIARKSQKDLPISLYKKRI